MRWRPDLPWRPAISSNPILKELTPLHSVQTAFKITGFSESGAPPCRLRALPLIEIALDIELAVACRGGCSDRL